MASHQGHNVPTGPLRPWGAGRQGRAVFASTTARARAVTSMAATAASAPAENGAVPAVNQQYSPAATTTGAHRSEGSRGHRRAWGAGRGAAALGATGGGGDARAGPWRVAVVRRSSALWAILWAISCAWYPGPRPIYPRAGAVRVSRTESYVKDGRAGARS